MRYLPILLFLTLFYGCATDYVVPTNRFITPETQGGFLNQSFELQATKGYQYTLKSSQTRADGEAVSKKISRTGYLYNASFAEMFDFIWAHLGASNSLLGGKIQFLGASRSAKGAGHKLAAALMMGQNKHQPRSKAIDFTLSGQEWILVYGYRFDEFVMPYVSLGKSTYTFEATPSVYHYGFGGYEVTYITDIQGLNLGIEGNFRAFLGKLELSYQEIKTTAAETIRPITFGFSVGAAW